jgi:hypothetical protein
MYDDRHAKYHRKPLQSIKDIMSDPDKFAKQQEVHRLPRPRSIDCDIR